MTHKTLEYFIGLNDLFFTELQQNKKIVKHKNRHWLYTIVYPAFRLQYLGKKLILHYSMLILLIIKIIIMMSFDRNSNGL